MPLTVSGDFVVQVRRLTSRQTQDLLSRCQKPNVVRGSGQPETVIDDEAWLRHAPDAYIAGWSGLTPGVLRELGIDLEDDPPTNGDGCIPWDAELARDVWREAQYLRFSRPIVDFSRDMLAAAEREKKSALAFSSASSSA